MSCNRQRVEAVSWNDVKSDIQDLHPRLADALKAVAKRSSLDKPFFVATYDYGDLIVRNGIFMPPCANRQSPVSVVETVDPSRCPCAACKDLTTKIVPGSLPLCLVLSGCSEVFLDRQWNEKAPSVAPIRLLHEGEMFGVFETVDSLLSGATHTSPWSVSAGARSVWVLAPLGSNDLTDHIATITQQKKFKWHEARPHWELIRSVTKSSKWSVRVLVLTAEVLQSIDRHDDLFNLLLETGWNQSAGLRHSAIRNAQFSAEFLSNLSSVASPAGELYQFLTLRHLVGISLGDVPAFRPARTLSRKAGPFDDFVQTMQKVMTRLGKSYKPVVMQPRHLSEGDDYGYYSFRYPSLVSLSPPKVAAFSDISVSVRQALEEVQSHHSIDHSKTRYFSKLGSEMNDIDAVEHLPFEDFIDRAEDPALALKDLVYLGSPFLVAGVRLVRVAGETTPSSKRDAAPA